jgi:hypothetical protein
MNIRSNFDVLQNKVTRLNSLVQHNEKLKPNPSKFANYLKTEEVTPSWSKRNDYDIDIEFYRDSNFFNNSLREDKLDIQIRRTKEKLSNFLNNSNQYSNYRLDSSNLLSTR